MKKKRHIFLSSFLARLLKYEKFNLQECFQSRASLFIFLPKLLPKFIEFAKNYTCLNLFVDVAKYDKNDITIYGSAFFRILTRIFFDEKKVKVKKLVGLYI